MPRRAPAPGRKPPDDPRPAAPGWLRRFARRLWLGFLVLSAAGLAAVALVVGVAAYHLYKLPLSTDFQEPRRAALTLVASDGQAFAVRGASKGRNITLEDLPDYLVDAVVTMEDRRFFEHRGVDPRGLLRAALANLLAGEVVQGGSTITQQVVRQEFLSAERTFTRKIQEAMLALWLEHRLTKQEILTRYLNSIYLGAGAYGVEAASRRYFNKPVSEVSLAEAVMLAGLIPAPSRFSPKTSPETAARRAALVLETMVAAGVLTAEAAAEAAAQPARLALQPAEREGYGYVADWAAAEARERLEGIDGEFRVTTTIDPRLQRLAVAAVERRLLSEAGQGASQAALVVLEADGSLRAMVGGRDYAASQFNRAVQAQRQPGSAFKLFVYLAALEAGFDPESRIADLPIKIGKWSPQNYNSRFHGRTTLRNAFARSMNAAAVRLQEEIGRERIIAEARALGLTGPLYPHPSLALGSHEVTLLELTAAYAAVMAGHRPVVPQVLSGIESPAAARLVMARQAPALPFKGREAMQSLLQEVVLSGTGRAAALPVPAYGKTGTSQDYRDAWFIGYAGDLAVGVWVGNDDRSPMDKVTGGRLPAQIWHSFMMAALGFESEEDLIATLEVAPASGPEAPLPAVVEAAPQPVAEPPQQVADLPTPELPAHEPPEAVPSEPEPPVAELPAPDIPEPVLPEIEPEPEPEIAVAPPAEKPLPAKPQPRPQLLAALPPPEAEPSMAAVAPPPRPLPRPQRAAPPQPEPVAPPSVVAALPSPPLPKPLRRPEAPKAAPPAQVAQAAQPPIAAKPAQPPITTKPAQPPITTKPAQPPKAIEPAQPPIAAKPAQPPSTIRPASSPEAVKPAPPPKVVTPAPEPKPAPVVQAAKPAPEPPKVIRPTPAPPQEAKPAPLPKAIERAPAPPPPVAPKVAPQVAAKPPPVAPQVEQPPAKAVVPPVVVEDLPAQRKVKEPAPASPPPPAPTPTPTPAQVEPLIGIPEVVDTATLRIGEHWINLEGVDGLSGQPAREMMKYIGGREVSCRPTSGRRFRCEVDGWDLSEVVIFNGGGRARVTASAELIEAERVARQARRGVWAR